jgi:hypothetical protein
MKPRSEGEINIVSIKGGLKCMISKVENEEWWSEGIMEGRGSLHGNDHLM